MCEKVLENAGYNANCFERVPVLHIEHCADLLFIFRRAHGAIPVNPVVTPQHHPPPIASYQPYDMSGNAGAPRPAAVSNRQVDGHARMHPRTHAQTDKSTHACITNLKYKKIVRFPRGSYSAISRGRRRHS